MQLLLQMQCGLSVVWLLGRSVCVLVTTVNPSEMAEPVKVPVRCGVLEPREPCIIWGCILAHGSIFAVAMMQLYDIIALATCFDTNELRAVLYCKSDAIYCWIFDVIG